MSDDIDRLARHVNHQLSRQTHPLYIVVDDDLRLRSVHGDPDHYGLSSLRIDDDVGGSLPLLATLDGQSPAPQYWRFVQLPGAPVCHVHLIRLAHGWGIALLDVSVEHTEQQARQQSAHELALLRDERERLLAELEEANRLKGEFIARMSHEFRTPLTSVIGYGEQLREQCEADKVAMHHVGAVIRGGRYLLNLVENLLDQARIEIDDLTVNLGACDLYGLGDEVEQLLRPVADQKSLSLAWWFDGSVPARVWTDPVRLKQILINLVGNAIKFTQTGGVSVEFEWRDDRLQVVVADTGPGIAEADAERIFEPFQQGDSGRHGKGAGLGLAISHTLVRALGGDLRLSSAPGKGARFDFDITARAIQGGRGSAIAALRDKVVVIADDDPDLLELFALYLKTAGCRPHTVSDGDGARAAIEQLRPAVTLLDLNLGDDDGAAVASALRNAGYRGRLVCLSASNDSGTKKTGEPFDAHWAKPISRGRLLDNLAELLG